MGTQVGLWMFGEIVEKRGRAALRALLRDNRLFAVFNGLYSNVKPDAEVVLAALQKLRPTAIIEGKSAIALHRGETPELPIQARVGTRNIATGGELVKLRRSRLKTVHMMGKVRVVTLLDAVAGCLKDGSVDELELRKLVADSYKGKRGVARVEKEMAALGTQDKTLIRAFLRDCIYGTDSGLERDVVVKLRKEGFTVRSNQVVAGSAWDMEIKELRVVLDVDSEYHHAGEGAREFWQDRWKTNEAQLAGWTALRITDDCVRHNWFDVILMLRRIREYRALHPRKALAVGAREPAWSWHMQLAGLH